MDQFFPSDGWRGIIGREFTLDFILSFAEGFLDFVNEIQKKSNQGFVIGYDTRQFSREYALAIANRIGARGTKVYLSKSPVPTPIIATYATEFNLEGAIIVTASHFPGDYNGIKFRFQNSRPPSTIELSRIIELAKKYSQGSNNTDYNSSDNRLVMEINVQSWYVDFLKHRYKDLLQHIKSNNIQNRKLIVDVMHGTTGNILTKILKEIGWSVLELRTEMDPTFGGSRPDPTEPNCQFLLESVKKHGATLGIAFDGDGDRTSFIEPTIGYIGSSKIPGLVLLSIQKNLNIKILKKSFSPCVVKTFPVTIRVDQLAEKNSLSIIEVPVGFRNIHSNIIDRNAIVGFGDDSSVIFPPYYSKNGFLTSLFILSLLKHGTLSTHLRKFESDFGELHYFKNQVRFEKRSDAESFLNKFAKFARKWNPKKIIKDKNSVKLFLPDDTWFLVRLAGTENYIRLYSEGPNQNLIKEKMKVIYLQINSYEGMKVTNRSYTKLN